MASLKKAVELDEDLDFSDDLEAEPDLKPLADMPGFKKPVEQTKQRDNETSVPIKKNDK